MKTRALHTLALGIGLALLAAACGGGDGAATTTAPASTTAVTTTAATTTTAPATTTTAAATTAPAVSTQYTAWIEAYGEVGECVDLAYNAARDDADYSVLPTVVDCAAPHDNEVFYVGEYPAEAGAAYPSIETFVQVVFEEICAAPFEERVGAGYGDVSVAAWAHWPLADAWEAGERTFACAFTSLDNQADDTPLYGTVRGPVFTFPDQVIAVIAEFNELDMWLYRFDTAGVPAGTNLTMDRSDLEEALQAPGWAPSGSMIVYAASVPGGETDLYLVDPADGEHDWITQTPGPEGGPEFSPDGTEVLFAAIGVEGEYDLFVLDLATAGVTSLTDSPDREASADWSPDGTRIVYRRETGGQSDIWVMNADGSDQRFFRGTDADEFDPSWSPDGTRVAYISDQTGDFEIWVAPVAGEGETRLTFDASDDQYPAWSPDSQFIVFNSDRYGYTGLFVVRADGSEVSPLLWDHPLGFAQFAPAQ